MQAVAANQTRIIIVAKRIKEGKCEQAKMEYLRFHESVLKEDAVFPEIWTSEDMVDQLFYRAVYGKKEFTALWEVVEMVLILSHWQATVERGFCLNKQTTVENLGTQSYCTLHHSWCCQKRQHISPLAKSFCVHLFPKQSTWNTMRIRGALTNLQKKEKLA